ncbi:MAG: hypothetical protein P4L90_17235 [Rhodopila sp.]|nr:hypothetical protein [Rhodopila sp.]
MNHDAPAYGLWFLAFLNSAVFIFFAFTFGKPQTPRDWRSFSAFSAFIVALFAEMYGFPLTIYLLSGWFQACYPGMDLMSHDAGHLWSTILGLHGDPHTSLPHLLSYAFIGGGFIVLSAAWNVLYQAQKQCLDGFWHPAVGGRTCSKDGAPPRRGGRREEGRL